MSPIRQFPRSQTERTVAVARVAVAGSGLFALWLGPAELERDVAAAYALHSLYALYSLLLAAVVWNRSAAGRVPLVTHLIDIILFYVFQYLPMGPSSPLFVYFTFSLFCGALRWRLRGTFGTAMLVLPLFLIVDASTNRTVGATRIEANRFIITALYLALTAGRLVSLG